MRIIKCTLILAILLIAYSQQNAYEILQLETGVTMKEVRSQFKRLALKYHPDRLQESISGEETLSTVQKQEKFFEIASAYSEIRLGTPLVLGIQLENYSEFFNKFFSEKAVCALSNDGTKECESELPESYPENPFAETNTQILTMANIGDYFKREEVWLILCFKSSEKYTKEDSMIKTWRKLGNKNRDMFLVGSVDCKAEQEICHEVFKIKDKDMESMAVAPNPEQEFKSLTGFVTSVKNLSSMAFQLINQVTVEELYLQNYQQIVNQAEKANKQLAMMFTDKNTVPKTFKIIANKFEPYFVFTTVNSVNQKMLEKFGVKEFPQLIILPDPLNVNSGINFEGEFKKPLIISWLMEHKNPPESKFEEYTKKLHDSQELCNAKDNKFCLIYNLQGDLSILDQIQDVPSKYQKSPLRFLYVREGFNEQLEGKPGFVLIKSKRGRYTSSQNQDKSLTDFIDAALSGQSQFQKIPDGFFESIKFE